MQDPAASPERVKAALKACGILGPAAASAIAEVAEQLPDPTLTAEAAVALSFMGAAHSARCARPPPATIRSSAARRCDRSASSRSGRRSTRARVVPLLIDGATDPDPGVRTVAPPISGIIHEGGADAVDVLISRD